MSQGTCKKADNGCCPQPPICPCCEPVIDPCLLQMCPSDPLSPANKCFLKTRAQCIINFARDKYIAPFCTKPEEYLPSVTGGGWTIKKDCGLPKKRADFVFPSYNPFILHDKTCKRGGSKRKVKKSRK